MATNENSMILPVKMSIISDVLFKNTISINQNCENFDADINYNIATQYKIKINCLAVEIFVNNKPITSRFTTFPTLFSFSLNLQKTDELKMRITKRCTDVGFYGVFGTKPSNKYDFIDDSTGKNLSSFPNIIPDSFSKNTETLWNSSNSNTILVRFKPYYDIPFLKVVPPTFQIVKDLVGTTPFYSYTVAPRSGCVPYKLYLNNMYICDQTQTVTLPYIFDNDVFFIQTESTTSTLPITLTTPATSSMTWYCKTENSNYSVYSEPLLSIISFSYNNMFRYTVTNMRQKVKLTVTVDNEYTGYLNGVQVLSGRNWQVPQTTELEMYTNDVIAFDCINWGTSPGGLLLEQDDLPTDIGLWKCMVIDVKNNYILNSDWKSPTYDDSNWLVPQKYGANGLVNSIWNRVNSAGIKGLNPESEWIWSPLTNINQYDFSSSVEPFSTTNPYRTTYSTDYRVLFRFYPTVPKINSVALINYITEHQVKNEKKESVRALFGLTELSEDIIPTAMVNPSYISATAHPTTTTNCTFNLNMVKKFTPTFMNISKLMIFKTLMGVYSPNERILTDDLYDETTKRDINIEIDNTLNLRAKNTPSDTFLFNKKIALTYGTYTVDDLIKITGYNKTTGLNEFIVPNGVLIKGFTSNNLTGTPTTYTNGSFSKLSLKSVIISRITMTAYPLENFQGEPQEFYIGNYTDLSKIKSFKLNSELSADFTYKVDNQNKTITVRNDCYNLENIAPLPLSMNITLSNNYKETVTIFRDAYYESPFNTYGCGKFELTLDLMPKSIIVSPVYSVTFYKDSGYKKVIETFTNNHANITWRVTVPKLYFIIEPRVLNPQITMFQHYLYEGCSKSLPTGEYNLNNLTLSWEKRINYIYLPNQSGLVIDMYDDNDKLGTITENGSENYTISERLKQSTRLYISRNESSKNNKTAFFYDSDERCISLGMGEHELKYLNNPRNWSNIISSFRVPYGYQILAYDADRKFLKAHVNDTVFIDWGTTTLTNDLYQYLSITKVNKEQNVYLFSGGFIYTYGIGNFDIPATYGSSTIGSSTIGSNTSSSQITKLKVDKNIICTLIDSTGRRIVLQEGIYDSTILDTISIAYINITTASTAIFTNYNNNYHVLTEKYRDLDVSLRSVLSIPETISFMLIQIFNSLNYFDQQKLLRYMFLPGTNVIDILTNMMNNKMKVILFVRDKIKFSGSFECDAFNFTTTDPCLEVVDMKFSLLSMPTDFEDYVDYKITFNFEK